MSLLRIKAVLLQEFYIMRHSLESFIDIFFFAVINIIVFGFVNTYLTGSVQTIASQYLLMGMIMWEIVRITQYSISIAALWNVWSRNLSNMFISPLSLQEYIFSQMISGVIKAVTVFIIVSLIALLVFDFNIFKLGFGNIILFYINLTIFAWSVGIAILGLIFRFSTKIQALAWSIIFLFQPLSAAFFPLSILPSYMQSIALLLPPTHVFEAARAALENPLINWQMAGIAFIENIIYFLLSLWFFLSMYKKSRTTGQFARNEG